MQKNAVDLTAFFEFLDLGCKDTGATSKMEYVTSIGYDNSIEPCGAVHKDRLLIFIKTNADTDVVSLGGGIRILEYEIAGL